MTVKLQDAQRIVCFGEILLRLAAPKGELLLQSPQLSASVGGAEANVAVSLARFGHQVAMVSTLPDNALGRMARDCLRGHGVDTRDIGLVDGRMGLYFLTPGAVRRPSEVIYDRAASAFAEAEAEHYDWPRLLYGASWFYVSGVTPAVGERSAAAALAGMRTARAMGLRVAFDGNYRASMWARQGNDGAALLRQFLHLADLAFVDQRDIALVLGHPELADGERGAAMAAAFATFPNLWCTAATVRVQHGNDSHDLSATLHTRGSSIRTGRYELRDVVERVGTGDAFAAGVLHGILRDWPDKDWLEFGLAAAGFKHAIAGDFNLADEAQVRAAREDKLAIVR